MLSGLGEILSVLCAVTWASAVICLRRVGDEIDPFTLNVVKIVLASVLFIPTAWLAGEDFSQIPVGRDLYLLIVSGAIGIGLADTLWLKALKETSASTVAILDCAYSPSVMLIATYFLGETLSERQWIGSGMVLSALLVVASADLGKRTMPGQHPALADNVFPQLVLAEAESAAPPGKVCKTRRRPAAGILSGIAAVMLMAFGVVLMKPALEREEIPLFITMEIRTLAGLAFLIVASPLIKREQGIFASFMAVRQKKLLVVGSLLASYVAMMFWVAGTKFTSASIAAILNQTSTVFIVIFARLVLREPISSPRYVAIICGLAGALLVLP